MSMSMYRPSKTFSANIVEHGKSQSNPKDKFAVRRSNSLPFNLSEDSRDVIGTESGTRLGTRERQLRTRTRKTRNIPEQQLLSSWKQADSISICSDGDDFFFPMDDTTSCDDGNGTHIQRCAQHTAIATNLVDREEKREAAITRLEHFFLGESCGMSTKAKESSSPVAVMDLPFKASPKRNMFGQVIDDVTPLTLQTWSRSSEESMSESNPTFSKLQLSDRAHSLPLTLHAITDSSSSGAVSSPLKAITKKPSLKKISSIGTSMSKKIASESNLLRTVSFSSLSIREYPPAISDNPSCSFGPPVQLDWEYEAEQTHPIDLYEKCRQPRRASHDLLLSYYDRRFLLIKQAGYSRKEVTEAVKAAERVKRERMLTDLFLPAQALDETVENFLDFVKRFFSKGESPTMEHRG